MGLLEILDHRLCGAAQDEPLSPGPGQSRFLINHRSRCQRDHRALAAQLALRQSSLPGGACHVDHPRVDFVSRDPRQAITGTGDGVAVLAAALKGEVRAFSDGHRHEPRTPGREDTLFATTALPQDTHLEQRLKDANAILLTPVARRPQSAVQSSQRIEMRLCVNHRFATVALLPTRQGSLNGMLVLTSLVSTLADFCKVCNVEVSHSGGSLHGGKKHDTN